MRLYDEEPKSVQMPSMLPELAWEKFLDHERWTDDRVLGAQPDCEIYKRWLIFQFRLSFGDLPSAQSQ